MNPGLWRKVKPLFEAALELPEGEREEFVAANLGSDPQAAVEALAMIRAHSAAASILDRSLPERVNSLPAEDSDEGLSTGQIISDRYRLTRELGRGGNGSAWEAADEAVLGRAVVIKVLHRGSQSQTFDTELSALARLDHPLIATPMDSGVLDDGRRYLVIEYVNGPTLRKVLQEGPLEPARGCRLVSRIGQALDLAHKQGVWHLDLKPENVLLRDAGSPDEQPVLVDFGISRLTGMEDEPPQPAASLAYAPGEQLEGAPTAASDQYSLARMAVEMITGHRPAPLEPSSALLARCAALHPRAMRVLDKALGPKPEERYNSASDFAAALANALDPQAAAARRRRLLAAAFCFLLFAATAVYAWLNNDREIRFLQQEAEAAGSQVAMVGALMEVGYLDQRLLADAVKTSVQRLKAHVDSGQRQRQIVISLFDAQIRYGLIHGHPGVPHLGSVEVGIRSLEDALVTLEIMYEGREKAGRYLERFVMAKDALASLLVEAGQYDRSSDVVTEALRTIDEFEKRRRMNRDFTNARASLLMTLSRVPFHRKNWDECLRLRNDGVRLRRLSLERNSSPGLTADLAGVLAARGYLYREMGRLEDALRDYAESDAILETLKSAGGRNLKYDWLLAKNQLEESRTLLLQAKPRAAEVLLASSASAHRLLIEESPQSVSIRRTFALSLSWLASARRRLGRPREEWQPLFVEAVKEADFGLSRDPQNAKAWAESEEIRGRASEAGVAAPTPPVPAPTGH